MGISDSAGREPGDRKPYDPWESDSDASDDMTSDLVEDAADRFVPPGQNPTAGSPRFDPDRLSLIALIASNFLAIAIAWFMGWSTLDVIIFYWIENLIIGFWTILRILFAQDGGGRIVPSTGSAEPISDGLAYMRRMQGVQDRPLERVRVGGISPQSVAEKLFVVPFFCFHYYMFCLVHGVFIQVFTTIGESGFGPSVTNAFSPFDFASWRNPIFTAEGFSLAGALAVVGDLYQPRRVVFSKLHRPRRVLAHQHRQGDGATLCSGRAVARLHHLWRFRGDAVRFAVGLGAAVHDRQDDP